MNTDDGLVYDETAEAALLGSVFVDQDWIAEVHEIVGVRDFYVEAHRVVWEAMLAINNDGADVDSATLASELKRRGRYDAIGGAAYLSQLIDSRPVIPHPSDYAKQIAVTAQRRRMHERTSRLRMLLGDPAATVEDIEKALRSIQREADGSVDELDSITFEELMELKPPPGGKWLIEGWWLQQGCGLVCGHPKANKSLWVLAMAMAVASGEPFLRRWPVKATGRALYIGEEDSKWTVQDRARKLCKALAIDPNGEQIRRNLILSCQSGCNILTQRGRGRVAALVRRLKPVYMALDTWGRVAESIDLNSYREVMEPLGWLRRLQAETGVAIAIVHHLKKADAMNKSEHVTQRAVGSIAFSGWFDSFNAIETPKKNSDERHVSAFHRSAGEMEKQSIRIAFDDEHDEIRIAIGEPPKGGKAKQQELDEAF